MDPKNIIWTERYRPSKVSEMVGDFRDKILKYLEKPDEIPHFLFHSSTPGTGKCLTGDSIFLTNKGLISFDDYCKKNNITNEKTDLVENIYCPENGMSKSEYFYKGKEKTISIKTSKGYNIEGTPEHKIKVFTIEDGIVWKKLKDISDNDLIPIFYNTQKFGNNNKIDYTGFNELRKENDSSSIMIKLPNEINKDISYLLGVFVANGLFNYKAIRISTFKPWLQTKLIKIIKNEFGIDAKIRQYGDKPEGVDVSRVWLANFLKHVCGVSENTARIKYIPKKILECSKDIQLSFIEGLLEDSWLSKQNYIEYYTASKQLANEVKYMLLNLGYIVKHNTNYLDKYEHTYHKLVISTEHSKKLLSNFDMIYKNNKISFNNNMNTNVLSYNTLIKKYVQTQRINNNIKKSDIVKNNLIRLNNLQGSFNRVDKNLYDLLKEPYLYDTIKLFIDNNIFIDTISTIKHHNEKDIYDFHIPETHSFLANGMINHNTTLAKAIINELECDYLILNSSDDRKIDVVRDKVKAFVQTQSSKPGMRRAVFLDEFDGMLKASQEALRNVMETYAKNAFFILTCNNINKVIEPLKSRCKVITFAYPKREEIANYLIMICQSEDMKYTNDGLTALIEQNYPSIRNCIVALQDLKVEGLDVIPENIKPVNEIFYTMWKHLQEKRWQDIKKVVMESTIDPRELNTFFWEKFLETTNTRGIQLTCRNEKDIAWGADAKIVFVSSLIEMVK